MIFSAAGVDFNQLTSWSLLAQALLGIVNNLVANIVIIGAFLGIWNDNSTKRLDKPTLKKKKKNKGCDKMTNMFNEDGSYNKTEWKAGDRITADKLNKIEESLEAINNNDISRHVEADTRLDALDVIKTEKVNVRLFGAIGDGLNDDTQAIQNSIDEAINKGIRKVFLPSGIYRITSSIILNSPIQIIGNGIGETFNPTVILKDGDFSGILVHSRDVVLENFAIKGNKDVDTSDGIIIGDTGYNAQSCVIRNVLSRNNGGDGIVLKQCNNGTFDNIVTLYNGVNGFSMYASDECNYSGNIINITNSYGNGGCGVVLSGEGNRFYICSQSNTEDNIRLIGWCTNCEIMGYTEFAENGYEINATGNVFANTIKGTYRSTTSKVYNSVTALTNNLSFSQDLYNQDNSLVSINDKTATYQLHFIAGLVNTPFASHGYLAYNNNLCFVDEDENSKEVAYISKEKIMFSGDICNNEEGHEGNIFLNDSNGGFDTNINIYEDGIIYGMSTTLKDIVTDDIVQVFVYVNDVQIVDSFNVLNATIGKTGFKDLNIKVVKGDTVSVQLVWFNNTSPRNNKAKVVLYKK